MIIPFHKPLYDDADEQMLVSSLRSGKLIGNGEYTKRATEVLAGMLGVKSVFLTTSCTHALELAMMVLDIRPGDEVIIPSFTFVSTANCIMRQQARVVFADITPSTLTIDLDDVQRRITSRTKAIIPVVYAGVPPELDELMDLARNHGIAVVEDAAQAIGALYNGRPQGTIGDIGCFSFHETKNVTTGEGGAFVTDNETYTTRAEIIREKGTNRRQFMLGLVDKYTWIEVGSSFLPPDSVGALLLSQLDKLDKIQRRREEIYRRYMRDFEPLAQERMVTLPTIPPRVKSNYHIFHVLVHDEAVRDEAIRFFRSRNIGTTFHYLPLHLSAFATEALGCKAGDFPVTESISSRLLRLPIYPTLTDDEQAYVIQTMKEFFKR
jgi:dTDP-4-amino-4,6-dideoxygalactose transaminase